MSPCYSLYLSLSAGGSGSRAHSSKVYEWKFKARVKKTKAVILGRENMFDCHPEEDAEAEDSASPPAAPVHTKKRKTTSKKAKAPNVQPPPPEPVTMKEMPAPEWISLHRVNPYRQDRDMWLIPSFGHFSSNVTMKRFSLNSSTSMSFKRVSTLLTLTRLQQILLTLMGSRACV